MLVGKIAVADDDSGDVDGRKPGDANPHSCAVGSDGPCHGGDSVQVARWQGDTPTDLAGYPPHQQTDEDTADELDGDRSEERKDAGARVPGGHSRQGDDDENGWGVIEARLGLQHGPQVIR